MDRDMTCVARWRALLLALLALSTSTSAQDVWTWVTGELADEREQERYESFGRRMFDYYQKRGLMPGELVSQDEIEALPADRVVLLGPIAAFADPAWFGAEVELLPSGGIRIGGHELRSPRTGVFLQSADKKRFVYTGLSLRGFEDIFSVPTGSVPCTVTVDGAARYRGSWKGGELELVSLSFAPTYPTPDELARLGPLPNRPAIGAVYDKRDALDADFTQLIDRLVKGQKVFFVGENHWNTGVNWLFKQILEHLLETQPVRAVFLELNFSFSAFLDYYVSLGDDREAESFLADELHALIDTNSELALLDTLRAWNREHPEQRITVACLDMEWGLDSVMKRVVGPFFASLEEGLDVRSPQVLGEELWRAEELPRLRAALEQLEADSAPGAYPFLTREFMTQVLINLEDTLTLGAADRMLRRQEHIVRNIVDFHGELIDDSEREGLTVFKGGGFHAQKNTAPDRGSWRDAAYLHQVHEPTRGRVANLYLRGVGYDFSRVHQLDLATRQPSATNYMSFVNLFQRGVEQGTARPGEYYILNRGGIGPLELLLARHGHHAGLEVVWAEAEVLSDLVRAAGQDPLALGAQDYDLQVFVLRSTLEPTRPLVYQKD